MPEIVRFCQFDHGADFYVAPPTPVGVLIQLKEGKMKRSYFKFETLGQNISVWWAQTSNPKETPQFKMIGQVPDTRQFRRLLQSKLKMMDDDTWSQPGEWTPDGWIVRWDYR